MLIKTDVHVGLIGVSGGVTSLRLASALVRCPLCPSAFLNKAIEPKCTGQKLTQRTVPLTENMPGPIFGKHTLCMNRLHIMC